ncbi:MAG: serine hydrolase [Clostridia bacterium]|nr:serine hydrolase [Clostridia bacterium]
MSYKSTITKRAKIIGVLICLVLLYLVPACNAFKKPMPQEGCEALRQQLQAYVDARAGEGRIGIYFRDLAEGNSLGINEQEPIGAASTIKAPIVLYLFQLVADGAISLEEEVAYQAATDHQSGAGAIQFFTADGTPYSLGTLANLAITLSDNIAWNMLERRLGIENIANYLWSIGGTTVYPEGQNISTAQDMGTYMQAILNFRDAHPELGERLLDYMSHTIWDQDGIPNRIPNEVPVAHKVGSLRQIANDVGIVFMQNRPYILAVMTDGFKDGFAVIAEISEMVYNYQLQKQYK